MICPFCNDYHPDREIEQKLLEHKLEVLAIERQAYQMIINNNLKQGG